ncbi:ORF83-like protein [Bufonid herpesvirus 1]|uniref:ORF83-like protein n=1 Tax=Bufonid herpesvirus 1 TaxID=2282206 RepID=UPI000EB750D1|nr:ORF83-like protein [Bufonid herpesvirus 1]AXF48550.1 ORF83-like protein [Bufonid herpesvirus 1]
MLYKNIINKVLPSKLQDLDRNLLLQHLCNVRVETLWFFKMKIRIIIFLFLFIFCSFVTTDGSISLAKAFTNKSAEALDNGLYVVFTLTVIYAVVSTVFTLALIVFTIFNMRKMRKHVFKSHKLFGQGHGYTALFVFGVVFHLFCVTRSCLLTHCQRESVQETALCQDVFNYAGAMNIIYTVIMIMFLGAIGIITEYMCTPKLEETTHEDISGESVGLLDTKSLKTVHLTSTFSRKGTGNY